jgi:hypothetical protein
MDPQADGQPHAAFLCQAGIQWPHGLHDAEPGPHGPLRIIFVRQGVAEVDEQAIAQILRDMPVKTGNHLDARRLIGAHDLPELFGVKLRRERGRADEVTEQHRELAAFRLGVMRATGGGASWWLRTIGWAGS